MSCDRQPELPRPELFHINHLIVVLRYNSVLYTLQLINVNSVTDGN